MLSYPSPSKLFANLFVILLCMGQVVDDIFVTNIGFVPYFEQKNSRIFKDTFSAGKKEP